MKDDLGLKCGLELHVQLDTSKLFCSCPSIMRSDEPDFVVSRKLRAVAGETGETDIAAREEAGKEKIINYEGYEDTTCLVELDEEPPHTINQEALDSALEIALLLSMTPVSEFHLMRKAIIDGSAVSGFQRTGLLARNGFIETSKGKVRISQLCLEEDAAKRIDTNTFRLDRMGIPLVEITTMPDIEHPEHCKEVAEKIGLLCKVTGKVMRGLGTVRQDVNVSIKDGARVEIKGVQDLSLMPTFVEYEMIRQKKLLDLKKELKEKDIKSFKSELINLAKVFEDSDSKLVKDKNIYGFVLKNFNNYFKYNLFPEHWLGKELADYVKRITGLGGLLHSDELSAYGISKKEVNKVRKKMSVGKDDGFVILLGNKYLAEKAFNAVIKRCNQLLVGVPEEVRAPDHSTGGTNYLRPLPGRARMYPETDEEQIIITDKRIKEVKKDLSETPEEKYEKLLGKGLNDEMAYQIIHSWFLHWFEVLDDMFPENSVLISSTLLGVNHDVDLNKIGIEDLIKIFKAYSEDVFSKEAIPVILEKKMGSKRSVELIIDDFKKIDSKELVKKVKKLINNNKDLLHKHNIQGILMGKLMKDLRGRVDAGVLSKVLLEELEKTEEYEKNHA